MKQLQLHALKVRVKGVLSVKDIGISVEHHTLDGQVGNLQRMIYSTDKRDYEPQGKKD